MTPTEQDKELREKLAAIEHQRWSDWQKWCHKVLGENMPSDVFQDHVWPILIRWEKQADTAYNDLTDKEKASDMEQVDRYWPLIQEYVAAQRQALRDEVMGAVGEDEDIEVALAPNPNFNRTAHKHYFAGRNQLRADIRTAISTIFEGEK